MSGSRSRWKSDHATWWSTMLALSAIGFILLVAPTIIVIAVSFNGGYSLHFPPRDVSLRWFIELFTESDDIKQATWTSLKVSSLATGIAVLLATPAALAVSRANAAWARALETAFLSPLMIPAIALGLGILVWLNLLGLRLSLTSLVIGHIMICAPYVFRTACIGFGQIDPSLLDASRSLGARRWRTFRKITLPLALPSLFAGAFLGFMASFDNVAISIFLSDARTIVLPIRLWSLMEDQFDMRVAAIAGVLIVATFVLLIVMERTFQLSRQVMR
jgi:putative spermidine/putrescine transport system permease protein